MLIKSHSIGVIKVSHTSDFSLFAEVFFSAYPPNVNYPWAVDFIDPRVASSRIIRYFETPLTALALVGAIYRKHFDPLSRKPIFYRLSSSNEKDNL